ncbi:MAG: hypothetical protein H6745_28335 [Deltaproteobacteria bacterium]|nr:hypothetical protein [Deltaproteobacteria bacterium]
MLTRALTLGALLATLTSCGPDLYGPPEPDTGAPKDTEVASDSDGGDVTRPDIGFDTEEPPLSHCSIDFELDRTCPTNRVVCGTFMEGGGGCVLEGSRGGCYFDGVKAYKVTPDGPVGITFNGSVTSLQLLFASETGASGTMAFFDANDQLVTALTTNGDCLTTMLPRQYVQFARPVRKATATASGGPVWIDAIEINP